MQPRRGLDTCPRAYAGRLRRGPVNSSPSSLADMVAFGVAPALVSYQWGVARIAESAATPTVRLSNSWAFLLKLEAAEYKKEGGMVDMKRL